MRDPDEVVELGSSGVGYMHHGVDLSEPAGNDTEQEAQRDALADYLPDEDED